MSNIVTYSFIIPHHNSPELLNRCLDSIPQREDIQIIVVDDNSKENLKPRVFRPDVQIIYIDAEHTKGAGRARNYGLKEAKGKWLLFADCDDYYVEGFLDIIDAYANSEYECIYFDSHYAYSDSGEIIKTETKLNKVIKEFTGDKNSIDAMKFLVHVPWNKMVCREFVNKMGFHFEEVPNGNDTMFTYQVGYFSTKIHVLNHKLYVYTYNRKSITNKKHSKQQFLSNLCNIKKNESFMHFIGHDEWSSNNKISNLIRRKLSHLRLRDAFLILCTYITNRSEIEASSSKYVDLMVDLMKMQATSSK